MKVKVTEVFCEVKCIGCDRIYEISTQLNDTLDEGEGIDVHELVREHMMDRANIGRLEEKGFVCESCWHEDRMEARHRRQQRGFNVLDRPITIITPTGIY